jgi:hypothetical protein
VTNLTGAGLTWTLVKRTNTQAGTAEIWRAFATSPLSQVRVTATLSQSVTSSITVMTFTGVDTSGANGSGAIGAIVHQDLQSSLSGTDTFWVQMQNAPTPLNGTTVTINDTAPTKDRYDLSICEVLPGS